jgi:hypothetical protein
VLNADAALLVPSLILEITEGITGDTLDGAAAGIMASRRASSVAAVAPCIMEQSAHNVDGKSMCTSHALDVRSLAAVSSLSLCGGRKNVQKDTIVFPIRRHVGSSRIYVRLGRGLQKVAKKSKNRGPPRGLNPRS